MKKFETPEIETIEFAVEDVITESGTQDEIINTTSCPPPMPIP